MADKWIDIFAGLRKRAGSRLIGTRNVGETLSGQTITSGIYSGRDARGRLSGDKFVLEFEAPDLKFNADEDELAKDAAYAIARQIRVNGLNGMAPNGNPLPKVSAATTQRREYRDDQAKRRGNASSRIKKDDERKKVFRNWRRRFKAAKAGTFTPAAFDNDTFGRESGMLFGSATVEPKGGLWTVFFANVRGSADRTGGSAVQRVFSRLGGIWGPEAWRQPHIQGALKEMVGKLMGSRERKALTALGEEIVKTTRLVGQLGGQVESIGKAGSEDQ